MMINQGDYNKFIGMIFFLYCLLLYAVGWWTGKPIDLGSLWIFLAPIVTHGLHIVTDGVITRTQINADATKEVAKAIDGKNSGEIKAMIKNGS